MSRYADLEFPDLTGATSQTRTRSISSGKAPCREDVSTVASKQMGAKENAVEEVEAMQHSAYEKACYDLTHSERVMNDRLFGRRVGLYELRGVIGSGNFSHVRFGIHDLTKGEMTSHCPHY